jgi:hypothetical protein
MNEQTRTLEKCLKLYREGNPQLAVATAIRHRLYETPFVKAISFPTLMIVKKSYRVSEPTYGEFCLVGSEPCTLPEGVPCISLRDLVFFMQEFRKFFIFPV